MVTVGVDADLVVELLLEDDELPHAASPSATTASARSDRILSKAAGTLIELRMVLRPAAARSPASGQTSCVTARSRPFSTA